MIKRTFMLDEEALRELERAARRLDVPKSQVVREALRVYGSYLSRLSDEEIDLKLRAFDRLVPAIPDRPRRDVEAELEALRVARKESGRGGTEA